jgi:hypothetical protein
MMAVAPNLTVLVGELVGARLIAHAGIPVFLLWWFFINRLNKCEYFSKLRNLLTKQKCLNDILEYTELSIL